ncbi:multiple sugar transport system substrate-binding protein [Marmoricola sp. OAE513]|uniref:extracellular solute-binding protein n=1 Tax=Marmoricola sp. OAE513 TaxID=2817894 RepID=UPI001AE34AE6
MASRASRGRVVLVTVLALAAGLAAGCSSDEKPEPTVTSAAPSGPTLLSFSVYGPPQVITAYARIAANYNAEHPKVAVSVRPYGTASASQAAFKAELAAGKQPDVFLAPPSALPDLVEEKAIRRVDDLLGEREVDFGDGFNRYSLEAFSSDNALQCMPVDVSPMVVYYNTDLIDLNKVAGENETEVSHDTGWTFSQFARAARSVQGPGVRGLYVAPTIEQLAPLIYSGNGDLVDSKTDPTTLKLENGSTEAALEKVLELVRDPLATYNEKQIARSSGIQRFKNGKLGMIFGYRSLTPELRTQAKLKFDVMPMPSLGKRATVGQSSGLCLSAGSEHSSKAADFMAYAVSDEAASILAETGFTVPTNVDVAHSDSYLQPGQLPEHAEVFDQQARYSRILPSGNFPAAAAAAEPLLTRLFYDALIEPLDERLKAIDEASVPVFTPPAVPTGTPSGSATPSP